MNQRWARVWPVKVVSHRQFVGRSATSTRNLPLSGRFLNSTWQCGDIRGVNWIVATLLLLQDNGLKTIRRQARDPFSARGAEWCLTMNHVRKMSTSFVSIIAQALVQKRYKVTYLVIQCAVSEFEHATMSVVILVSTEFHRGIKTITGVR